MKTSPVLTVGRSLMADGAAGEITAALFDFGRIDSHCALLNVFALVEASSRQPAGAVRVPNLNSWARLRR